MSGVTLDYIKQSHKKVFGFGAVSNNVLSYLLKKDIELDGIFDNDKSKWGKRINEVDVLPVDSIKDVKTTDETLIIIVTYTHWEEMEKQIRDLYGIECLVALRDVEEFHSVEYQAFCNNINLYELTIDTLHMELSSICNCRCVYCPFHGYPQFKNDKRIVSWNTVEQIVRAVKNINTIDTLDIVGNGEIFLHKEWFEIVSYVVDKLKIQKIVMYTNGMLLNEENVNKIMDLNVNFVHLEVSIDGKNPDENDIYRNGSVYRVVRDNIYNAYNVFKNDERVQMLITNCYPAEEREVSLNRIVEQVDRPIPEYLEEDFPFLPKVSKWTLGHELFGSVPGFNKMKVEFPDSNIKCLDLFHRIAFDVSGKMIRCSCWQAGVDTMASVFEDDVVSIWFNDSDMNCARENIIQGNANGIDMCTGCPRRGMGEYYLLTRGN